jgi:hypothetical protein
MGFSGHQFFENRKTGKPENRKTGKLENWKTEYVFKPLIIL